MRIPLAGFVIVVISLAACAPSVDDRELADARDQWAQQIPDAYELTWQQQCFCTADMVRPIRIRVAGGQIASASFIDDGTAVGEPTRGRLTTVDGVFDMIESAIDANASSVDVDYDATWGYPAAVFVDYNRRTADEELTLELSDFAPIE
jgi:hypothetical protein